MKKLYIFCILLLSIQAVGQTIPSYYERNLFLRTSPAVFQEGQLGYADPANLYFLKNPELQLNWTADKDAKNWFDNWGLFGGLHGLGLGVIHRQSGEFAMESYQLSIGFGNKSGAMGIGYNWQAGDKNQFGYEKLLTFSTIMRPNRYLSAGLVYSLSTESNWDEGYGEIGVRPLGTSRLTLFVDGAIAHRQDMADAPWSAGIVVEAADGINLFGRYFDDKSFRFGISIGFGFSSLGGSPHYDKDKKLAGYSFSYRLGGMRPSIINQSIYHGRKYVPFNMKGTVSYNKYIFFDGGTMRYMDILKDIQAAIDDPRVAMVVMNLSGMHIYPEHAWEIREALKEVQKAGKRVIIFLDETPMAHYYLASVADKIILDPSGSLRLPGFAMSRTYFKGTLDKLGIGFDPWRFQKYKSGPEGYSRSDMSEASREQNQAYIDDRYEQVREDICTARGINFENYDNIINETPFLIPEEAVKAGLVDTLGRWSDKTKIIKNLTGELLGGISRKNLYDNALPRSNWGEPDKIAVVYGVGDCEMDKGIRARYLERLFLHLARAKQIKAVVFRVDSPGGLMMPSDLVAQAVKKCAEAKPLIVSQGQIAASGGYMISAYADSILAGPGTVAGSIGVYGGWVYDEGFGDKIGMTSDLVKRGDHADLGYGIRLPYLGLQLPSRNLTSDEYDKMKDIIDGYYKDFVTMVAEARGRTYDEIDSIAQGRIYSGTDAVANGLVDEIGGLIDAIEIAKKMAGIDDGREVEIIETPKSKGWFKLDNKLSPFGMSVEADPVYNYLRMLTESRWQPLPMLEPGLYPEME